jgi:DNA-binding HxlR family transcriptional regulator
MRWGELAEEHCSVARTLSVVGDRWTMLVLRQAFLGTRRFGDFLTALGISRPVLKERLDKLVENEVMERQRYEDRPPRYEYRLTEKGRDLYPIMIAMLGWGDRWMAGDEGPPLVLRHRGCGSEMLPVQTCPHCGDTVDPRDVEARYVPPDA